MADEPDEGLAPADQAADQAEAEPQDSDEAVRVAGLMGWKPKDQWRGDATGWKPASAFLAEVPEVIRGTREKNKRLEGQMARVVGEVAKLSNAQQTDAARRREAAMAQFVEAGDLEGAKRVLADAQSASAPPPGEAPAFTAFKDRNPWFSTDPEAAAYVVALDRRYAQESGGNIADPDAHMRKIEAGVKKRFPEHFAPEPKVDREPPPRVGRGSAGPGRAPSELTEATMNSAQRQAAKDVGVSPAAYVKSWNATQSSRERA